VTVTVNAEPVVRGTAPGESESGRIPESLISGETVVVRKLATVAGEALGLSEAYRAHEIAAWFTASAAPPIITICTTPSINSRNSGMMNANSTVVCPAGPAGRQLACRRAIASNSQPGP